MKLKKPITIFINLSKVDVGKDFSLETHVLTSTYGEAGGEGGLLAYFRDPVNPVGGSLEYTGLQPSSNPPTPRQAPEPLPECKSGPDPAAGAIQLSAASYNQKEVPVSRNPVLVTRAGGSKGAVSARLTSSDGTAHAGPDFTAVDTVVYFGDGDSSPRILEVPIVVDTIPEPDKNLTLALSDPRGCAALGTQKTTTLNILYNDRLVPDNSHTLGGTVSGLAGAGLVIQDRTLLINRLTPTGNGPFSFFNRYQPNTAYDVQVVAQPGNPIQTCSVTNPKGTITDADVSDVAVNWVTQAQTPGLDPSFGGGKVTTSLVGGAEAMALQPDGKIVALNSRSLARFNPDGSLDTGFGTGGTLSVAFSGGNAADKAVGLAIQPDGKILVGGHTGAPTSSTFDFALVRYNANGSLDTGFGTGGEARTDFGGSEFAVGVLLQPDGRILVVGYGGTFTAPSNPYYALARYTAGGAPDSSFGSGGKAAPNITGVSVRFNAAALQGDGKIVMVGQIADDRGGGGGDVGLVRFNANGNFDTGFGDRGISRTDLGNGSDNDEATDVIVQPDGKILVTVRFPLGATNFGLARFNADGKGLDGGFGGGLVTTAFGSGSEARALALQADDEIVVVGRGASDFGVARYGANGGPDTGFDGDGKLTLDFFGGFDSAEAVVIQPDARIVVGGSAKNGSSAGIRLARIKP